MNKKIAVSAGHCPSSPGACHKGNCEFQETLRWANAIERLLKKAGLEVVRVPTGSLREKVAVVNEAKCDLALEVHFNACGGCGASGCETLYCPKSKKGKKAATAIQKSLVKAMGNKDRGVKEGWYKADRPGLVDYRGDIDGDETPLYFLKATNCPAVIIEPEFVEHWNTVHSKKAEACEAVVEGVLEYLK